MENRIAIRRPAAATIFFVLLVGLHAAEPAGQAQAGARGRTGPDAVVATVDGEPLRAGVVAEYLRTVPEALQPRSAAELRPVLERLGLERRLAKMAEKGGLDKQHPYSTMVHTAGLQVLATAQLNTIRSSMLVANTEIDAWYKAHEREYSTASVQVAFFRYDGPGARRSKLEAEVAAWQLAMSAREGKPFGALVDASSDEHPFVTRKGSTRQFDAYGELPHELKQAILARSDDPVVGPFAVTDGIFVCRIVNVSRKPLSEANDQVLQDVREAKVRQWVESQMRTVEVRMAGK